MPPGLGPVHLLVVLLVALVVLGPERLPETARQIGRAMVEVRRWSGRFESEIRGMIDVADSAGPLDATDAGEDRDRAVKPTEEHPVVDQPEQERGQRPPGS